jgi:hypothetical protein
MMEKAKIVERLIKEAGYSKRQIAEKNWITANNIKLDAISGIR